MIGGLFLKWFLGGGWKTIISALLVGGFIAGIATLFGAWQIEKGQSSKYLAERDAALTLSATWEKHLTTCLNVNADWEVVAADWNEQMTALTTEADLFRDNYNRERARRRAAAARIEDLEAQMDEAITATDCEGALDQLVAALGWAP